MKTERKISKMEHANNTTPFKWKLLRSVALLAFMVGAVLPASAHCDSYDGPVIKDALVALEQDNVELVLKWVEPKYEKVIIDKFRQTINLKGKDIEINKILETNFLETLVRLHREGEGESYTGLKPAGSVSPLINMADNSLENNDGDHVVNTVTEHLEAVLRKRHAKAAELSKTKDVSIAQGRAYVEAYVEYTHTLEALEHILHGTISHAGSGHSSH